MCRDHAEDMTHMPTSSTPLNSLSYLLRPRSIAVLGASPRPESIGNTTVLNLVEFGFTGKIYPIHPTADEVHGLTCYADLADVPGEVDCAAVALSADKAIPNLRRAASLGLKSAVIFASGFAETSEDGARLQGELQEISRETGLAVCGPNCLGLANITERTSLYSAALPEMISAGNVAVLSHSGSGCIVLSNLARFGFSYVVSSGNSAVVDVAEYLSFLAADEATHVAALVIEAIRDPDAFAAAAGEMRAAGKPIVALKIGRSEKGVAAAAAHTGSLAGSEDVYREFFRRHGVIAVDDLDELVECVSLMSSIRRLPTGSGLGVINVSGGENAMTCDVAERVGVDLPELSAPATERLARALPAYGNPGNPLDATGTAVFDMEMYRACIEGLASDPAIHLVAVSQDCPREMGTSQADTYRTIAETTVATAGSLDKPLVFYSNVAAGIHPRVAEPLRAAGVPILQGSHASLLAFRRLFAYAENSRRDDDAPADIGAPDAEWHARLATGAPLTEREAKEFLKASGVAVTNERATATADEAVAAARDIGFPVALKIESPDLPHKSDIGGVRLGLATPKDVVEAFDAVITNAHGHAPDARIDGVVVQEMVTGGIEIIAGLARNDPFGMAVVVGAGGVLVELVDDSALALAPVSDKRAHELIGETRVGRLLGGYRGAAPGDTDALAGLIVTLSTIAMRYGDVIEALDLNPVLIGNRGAGLMAADALLVPRQPAA